MRALRVQGWLFCALAAGVAALSALLPRPGGMAELLAVAGLILLLGVPHGALDGVFAREVHGVRGWRGWAGFGALYLGLAAAVVAVWAVVPAAFLLGFLLVSALHFSADPEAGAHPVSRLLYGGAVVVLPLLLHRAETEELLGMVAGEAAGVQAARLLAPLAAPWLGALALAAAWEVRRSRLAGLELLAVGVLMTMAPPLVGFTVFFCAMHGARHILRASRFAPVRALLRAGVPAMLIVAAGAGAAWAVLRGVPVDARVMQVVFVGLAALTVPHMALIERARGQGWAPAGR